ncbi:hypothetical protein DEW08_21260 [Azospirillum thermophilum]|uniref:histidine kinase n=1 Tax=Azospirillum thermophilum TaxID=2202148 RepID=A0A2S2CVX1_9PROT|nr:hypothetical protein DEW08_21260 [Azospirillum thermophilum]
MLLMVLPLLGFSLYSELSHMAEREAALHDEARRWLSVIEDEEAHVFTETDRLLDLLIDSGTAALAPDACMATLARQAGRYPNYLTVTITGADGVIRCASTSAALGFSIADRPTFLHVRDKGGGITGVSAPSRYSGKLMIPLVKRYDDAGGRFAGAVTGLIDVGWLEDLIQRKPLPPDTSLLIADRAGVVFARAPHDGGRRSLLPEHLRPLLIAAQPGVGEIREGQRRLITAWSPFGNGLKDTLTILSIDRDVRMAPISRAALRSVLLSAAVVLGAVAASGLALHRYLRYRERVEQALRRAQEHLSLVLSSVEAGVWEWDVRTDQVTWSTGLYRLFGVDNGFTPSFTSWLERLPADEQTAMHGLIQDLFSRRQTEYRLEHRILRSNGEACWLLSLGRVFYGHGGEAERMVGLTVDVTRSKKAEQALRQSEEHYRSLVESQTDIVVRLDTQGRYTFVNDTACRVFGRPYDELIGSHWQEFTVDEDVESVKVAIGRMEQDPSCRVVVEARVRAGRVTRWYLWEGGQTFDEQGRFTELQAVGRDITDRKLMEERLCLAKKEAELAASSKSRFLAAASHDLRQPMQSLILFAAALHRHVDAQGQEQLDHLERSLEALKGLLDSLLDVSRLDAGLVRPQIVDIPLSAVLDELDAAYRPIAEERGLSWSIIGCAGTVHSDRILLARLLRNLVENALRYTRAGGVTIRCRRDGDHLLIEVKDTGIGIPDDQRERIFEEFVQIGNVERNRRQGLGLGLAIVRRIARLLDYRIDVWSQEGKGSLFSVRVPRGSDERPQPTVGTADRPPVPRLRPDQLILVIDDEVLVGLALQAILQDWGCEVLTATTIDEALERLRRTSRCPDIILADYRLGGGVLGTEAITRLRHVCGRDIPALLLTGETAPAELREAATRGLSILHKPVTPHHLAEALNALPLDQAG